MSEKLVIDLTDYMSKIGEELSFVGEFVPAEELLSYPSAVLDKISVNLGVTFLNPDVQVSGIVTCYVTGNCDRCFTNISRAVKLPFNQVFYKDNAKEEDGYVYCNSRLDLTKAVFDEIVLSMPSLLLCKDDCKGLCPKCGANLNEKKCECDITRENPFSVLKNLKF